MTMSLLPSNLFCDGEDLCAHLWSVVGYPCEKNKKKEPDDR